jgi:hypothetical protein
MRRFLRWFRRITAKRVVLSEMDSRDMIAARAAIMNATGFEVTHLAVGEDSAKALGLPCAGSYILTEKGYVLQKRF